VIFPLPEADATFIERWQRQVDRAHAIWQRALEQPGDAARRKADVAYRLLWRLMRLRDALSA
jgi:hypothetical protein